MNIRIIPRLDIKGPNLVKGIHLEGLRVLGSPEEYAKYYYENGADELFYQDVVASLYDRNSLDTIITRTAKMEFIPLTVGGGIRSIADIRRVLNAGADKVSINTEAIKNPSLIKEAARIFGSSTIVVSIEAIKQTNGQYLCYTDNGREQTGIEVGSWASRVADLGAGEICITSVDKEGTGAGFDIELVSRVAADAKIPIIAHGGAGSPKDIEDVIRKCKIDAIALSSILHYDYISRKTYMGNVESEGNYEFLKNNTSYGKISPSNILDIKRYLHDQNIQCRHLRTHI
jgi:imidazole glycerol-phosphate synthase subunit HisF